ncbi:MAG: SIMPL domain-containing protein, partial [Lachnospiraceae bacterium]
MERTIRVTGKGKISVKPDRIQLLLTLEDVRENYAETLKTSAEQTEGLKDCFETLGFQRSDLKTVSFQTDAEYESYQDEKNNWKRRFVGYKFVHGMKIEFDADHQLLGKVLYALAHGTVRPELHINYTIRDTEAAKNL